MDFYKKKLNKQTKVFEQCPICKSQDVKRQEKPFKPTSPGRYYKYIYECSVCTAKFGLDKS